MSQPVPARSTSVHSQAPSKPSTRMRSLGHQASFCWRAAFERAADVTETTTRNNTSAGCLPIYHIAASQQADLDFQFANLTTPAPATFAWMACCLGGARRRRICWQVCEHLNARPRNAGCQGFTKPLPDPTLFFEIISRMGSQPFGKRPPSPRSSKHSRSNRNVAGPCKRLDSIEFHGQDTTNHSQAGSRGCL